MPLKWKKKIMFASENCTYVSFKMSKGEEESFELGWDFSLRVQSRRVVAMHSVWLIEERNGGIESNIRYSSLGSDFGEGSDNGKKRPRKESGNHIIFGVEGSVVVRKDRLVGKTHFILMATRRRKRDRIKRELTNKLGELLGKERDDDTLEELIDAKIQLNLEIEKDEMFWEQRAKYEDGRVVVEETKMEKITRNYFQNLFSTSGTEVTNHILVGMLNCIFNEANLMLTKRHTVDEIVTALKGIGPTNALGDDDFSALFFQKCCHIMGREIANLCLEVLNGGKALDTLNITNIVLILKIPHPKHLKNFRPISLCIVIYKLIAKVIANHFQRVLEDCIDSA
ncbi:hypothetical protein Golax_002372 [Gossypium laxum]|uniref:Uncharacterized protein n=1 Tax=Gossypium laxum TaxID=34288 RepID=A0A7J9ARF9_9ROSI|nr:hypothetical protein [Gossypium laxum]